MTGNALKIAMLAAFLLSTARAQMIRSDSIQLNDPALEKLCLERMKDGPFEKSRIVPFEIDRGFVERYRQTDSKVTFIAIDGYPSGGQLIECTTRTSGRFEPGSVSPENRNWRLIKPPQAPNRLSEAPMLCGRAATAKIDLPNLDHYSNYPVIEFSALGYPNPMPSIGGTVAERYDLAVKGTAIYKSTGPGPDMKTVDYGCLFSPMLVLKAIEIK